MIYISLPIKCTSYIIMIHQFFLVWFSLLTAHSFIHHLCILYHKQIPCTDFISYPSFYSASSWDNLPIIHHLSLLFLHHAAQILEQIYHSSMSNLQWNFYVPIISIIFTLVTLRRFSKIVYICSLRILRVITVP